MGALNVAHNENGITHFIECCFPVIREQVPGVKLFIIGGGASDKLKQYENNDIIFMGRVPDVRIAVGECEVFICPLQFGSGIKTKNLEAMAMGIAVVTTPIGAENIDAVDGAQWVIGNTDISFSSQVVSLLKDVKLRETIGENGQKFVRDNFSWKVAENSFAEVFTNE